MLGPNRALIIWFQYYHLQAVVPVYWERLWLLGIPWAFICCPRPSILSHTFILNDIILIYLITLYYVKGGISVINYSCHKQTYAINIIIKHGIVSTELINSSEWDIIFAWHWFRFLRSFSYWILHLISAVPHSATVLVSLLCESHYWPDILKWQNWYRISKQFNKK